MNNRLEGQVDGTYLLNVYPTLETKAGKKILIRDWFALIRQSVHSELIEKIRSLPDESQKVFKDFKCKRELPIVLYNFSSDSGKQKSDLTHSTGLIFTEIDLKDNPTFDIKSLDERKIFAYYRSLRGKGWHILIKVSNLSIDNFKAAWNAVNRWLGIDKPDKGVCKPSQPSYLSYDPELFFHPDSVIFEYNHSQVIDSCISKPIYCPILSLTNNPHTYETVGHLKIRFDNLSDFTESDQPYKVYRCGFGYVKCYIGKRKISQGKRNDYMLAFVKNLVWLNPSAPDYQLFHVIRYANQKMFFEPLPEKELLQKLAWAITKQKAGELKPRYAPRPKKIAFNPKAGFTGEEKKRIYCDLLIDESKEKIRQALLTSDYLKGNPSYRKLAELTRLGKTTIARHLKAVQAELAELKQAA